MSADHDLEGRALALRQAFDLTFATHPESEPPPHEALLVIGVGDQRYALRLAHVLSLHADRPWVKVPSPSPALLGLTVLRGSIAPVYDLARLLGHTTEALARWLILVRGPTPLGLAFQRFDAHLRLERSNVLDGAVAAEATPTFTRGSATTPAGPVPLVDVPRLVEEISRNRAGLSPRNERSEDELDLR